MAAASLIFAAAAIAVAALAPAPLDLAALSLAVAAIATGLAGYRRRDRPGARRLEAAAGAFIGAAVFAVCATKVVITTVAVRHLAAGL